MTDLVTLEHLRTHSNVSHCRKNCEVKSRDINNYHQNLAENLTDDRNSGNMRKCGKEHDSIIKGMLFPILCLANIVLSILHIILGIVLVLFNELELRCKMIDGTFDTESDQDIALNNQIDQTLHSIERLQNDITDVSSNIIDATNCLSRLDTILTDPSRQDLDVMAAELCRNKKAKSVNKDDCHSPLCLISKFDINRSWIACENSSCGLWSHSIQCVRKNLGQPKHLFITCFFK